MGNRVITILSPMGQHFMESYTLKPIQIMIMGLLKLYVTLLPGREIRCFLREMKAFFQNHVRDLVNNHNLAVVIIMETKIGGEQAREITDRLPFDEAIHTDTIGYAGGLWLLWDSDRVEVTHLSSIEQEIHAIVKVRSSNLS